MAKKGTCLASCRGELRAGPSGWIHLDSEALDFLTFWRAEQREGIVSPFWRPPPQPSFLPFPLTTKRKNLETIAISTQTPHSYVIINSI